VLVTSSPSPGTFVDDLEPATRGSPWMRGITPGRLGVIALLCLVGQITNDTFPVGESLWLRIWRTLQNAGVFFLAALPMLVLVVRAEIHTARSSNRTRIAVLALAVVAGALLFALVRWGLRLGNPPRVGIAGSYWQYSFGHFFGMLVKGGLLTSVLYFIARERDSQRRLLQTRLARVEIGKQMTEARLQLLQAQIEPHFLFNSLASVKRLYETEPEEGRSLLRNLGNYLRVAISRAGLREARLGEEVALARSFLAIFQVRMGQRLSVRIDVPAELESGLLPPLMLGTLVENAIKHGIGPRAGGGTVCLTARRDEDVLAVEVADDGVGFRARSGHGIGLANIRARLETQFAASASLELAGAAGGGVIATLRLPFHVVALPEAT
jgi:sensor histidine kinase YesM